jgi:hypothetical protein
MYKIGIAHGIVLGPFGLPFGPGLPSNPQEDILDKMYAAGQLALLQRPALMMEAFDRVCGDYRNTSLKLYDVAMVATLEIGGLQSDRTEAALALFRATSGPTRQQLIRALSNSN